jgi:hypothetical protein
VFKTVDQPAVVKGNWTGLGFCILGMLATATLAYIQYREKTQQSRADNDYTNTEEEEDRISNNASLLEESGKLAPALEIAPTKGVINI